MSLATRCPVCQTVFRVVQDQLKVSEGWVRCGRCAKVFNAFEGLFDLEREFPALRGPSPSQRVLEDLATRNRQPRPASAWQDEFDTRAAVREAPHPAAPAAGTAAAPPSQPSAGVGAVPGAAAPAVARPPASVTAPATASAPAVAPARSAPPAAIAAPDRAAPHAAPAPLPTPPKAAAPEVQIRDEPAALPGDTAAAPPAADEAAVQALFRSDGEAEQAVSTPDDLDILLDGARVEPAALDDAVDSRLLTFVQQADKAQRWRRPWVRATLAAAALLLALLLGVQLVIAQRDLVVSRWPGMRTLVQSLCAPLSCRIEPLRRIEQLSVDSSGLTRIDDGPVYRLVLVLRNRGDLPLLVPAIDLSLTDASGALVSRRMLAAGELGAARNTIGAGQELPLQALLMSGDRPLTGYTIEIFYP